MKRTPIQRRTPLRQRRSTPRRRPEPRWDASDWSDANQTLLIRSGGLCERCGKEPWTQRHHRKRRKDGGETFANVVALCADCHSWCHAHPALSRQYGWIVPTYADPVTVPFLRHRREWVLFDLSGGMVPAFAIELPESEDIEPERPWWCRVCQGFTHPGDIHASGCPNADDAWE